jgi:lysophospholipase L1-like esterase
MRPCIQVVSLPILLLALASVGCGGTSGSDDAGSAAGGGTPAGGGTAAGGGSAAGGGTATGGGSVAGGGTATGGGTAVGGGGATSGGGATGGGNSTGGGGGTAAGGGTASADATLATLTISAGALSPAFSSAILVYAVTVPNGTASVTITPTASSPGATVALSLGGGAFSTLASGATSGPLAVPAVGSTSSLIVRVTAADAATRDYTLTITQAASSASSFTIYSIGDSTMADYDPAAFPNQRGWGQMFPQFLLGNDVTFVNQAKNGRSSKSFYVEGSWDAVKAKLRAGDYVFIQFAHNDEKDNGLEGDGGIGTEPFGAFQTFLGRYVDESRDAGATPILFTPVVRRYFSGATITPKGAHDLTGVGDPSIPVAQDLNYVEAMKQVGTTRSCPVIDLTASTRTLVEQFGPTDAKSILYISADDTHLQPLGATLFAQLAVQALITRNLLASHLSAAADLVVSPQTLDFGSLYLNATADKTVSVTGLALTPDVGSLSVSAPAGFAVSLTPGGPFTSSLELSYTGGKLPPTALVLRFAPAVEQRYTGVLSVAPVTGATRTIALSGTGLTIPAGGVESTATWSLTADATCAATGLAACSSETFSNLYAKNYQVPSATATTWTPAQPASTITQRVSIVNDTWGGSEIDIVPTRYVQFAASALPDKTWTVDALSLWAGAGGGSNLGYRIEYSTQADFSAETVLVDSPANATYAMVLRSFNSTLTVHPGETLYVRVFPWYKGAAASGKYLCLQSLTVHGWAQ